jgi:hypothetical protein
MLPINLNTRSSVKPTILKGSNTSQMSGNSTNISKASGQHATNSKHQSASAINVLMIQLALQNRGQQQKCPLVFFFGYSLVFNFKIRTVYWSEVYSYSDRRHCTGLILAALMA